MAEEFEERDLTGASFWGVRLRDATYRDVDFTGGRMHHVLLQDVEIDGFVDRLVINGVDVTDHVNANDPWQPLRGLLQPTHVASIRQGWDELDAAWTETLAAAAELTPEQRRQRVDGEWSFLETLRHLVFAVDKWFTVPITGGRFQALGLPNSGSADFPFDGIDPAADPSEDEILAARRRMVEALDAHLNDVTDDELPRRVEVPESGTATVLQCWHVVLEEGFEHLRYARRDLATLVGGTA